MGYGTLFKKDIYLNRKIFESLTLDYTMVDADSGNIGGNKSNEFHVIADTGEDDLLLDEKLNGMNLEIAKIKYSEDSLESIIKKTGLMHKKGIEVGHIFKLGQKYSEKMKAKITTKESKSVDMFMGCYGIGVTRIVAAAIEQSHDSNGIIWPKSISPFEAVIVEIDGHKNNEVRSHANEIYEKLRSSKLNIIYDDRDASFGNKMKDWELIGIPKSIIIGKKEAKNKTVTYKSRTEKDKSEINVEDILGKITK